MLPCLAYPNPQDKLSNNSQPIEQVEKNGSHSYPECWMRVTRVHPAKCACPLHKPELPYLQPAAHWPPQPITVKLLCPGRSYQRAASSRMEQAPPTLCLATGLQSSRTTHPLSLPPDSHSCQQLVCHPPGCEMRLTEHRKIPLRTFWRLQGLLLQGPQELVGSQSDSELKGSVLAHPPCKCQGMETKVSNVGWKS